MKESWSNYINIQLFLDFKIKKKLLEAVVSYGVKYYEVIFQIHCSVNSEMPTQLCWLSISLNEVLAQNCGTDPTRWSNIPQQLHLKTRYQKTSQSKLNIFICYKVAQKNEKEKGMRNDLILASLLQQGRCITLTMSTSF